MRFINSLAATNKTEIRQDFIKRKDVVIIDLN